MRVAWPAARTIDRAKFGGRPRPHAAAPFRVRRHAATVSGALSASAKNPVSFSTAGVTVLVAVVEVDVVGAVDPEQLLGLARLLDRSDGEVVGDGLGAGDHQQRARRDERDQPERVELGEQVQAARREPVLGAGVMGPLGAVVVPALVDVAGDALLHLAALGLVLGVDLLPADLAVACLAGTGGGGQVQHRREFVGRPGAAEPVAEPAPLVGRADGADGPDPVIGRGRRGDVPARGADAERADPLGVDLVADAEEGDGALDVLDPLRGVLQEARQALAVAPVGRVEGEGHEAGPGQPRRVEAGGLLLHAGHRVRRRSPDAARRQRCRG